MIEVPSSQRRRIIAVVVGVGLLHVLINLLGLTEVRPPSSDEGWYAATADGVVRGLGVKNYIIGSGGGDLFFAYPVALAAAFQAFGVSLWAVRIFSLLWGGVAVSGLAAVGFLLRLPPVALGLSVAAFMTSNLTFVYTRTGRPEAMGVGLLVWALWALLRARGGAGRRYVVLAGALALVAALSYPATALLAGVLALVPLHGALTARPRRLGAPALYLGSLVVAGLILIVFALYFAGTPFGETAGLLSARMDGQFSEAASRGERLVADALYLVRKLSLGGKRVPGLLVQLLVLGWALWRWRRGDALPGLLAMVLLLWVAAGLALLPPFRNRTFFIGEWLTYVLLGLFLADVLRRGGRARQVGLAAAGVLLLNGLAGDLIVLRRDLEKRPWAEVTAELRRAVPPGSTILSDLRVWLAVPEPRFYCGYTRWHLRDDYDDVKGLLASGDLDYVVRIERNGVWAGPAGIRGKSYDTRREDFARWMTAWSAQHAEEIARIDTGGLGDLVVHRVDTPRGEAATRPAPPPGW